MADKEGDLGWDLSCRRVIARVHQQGLCGRSGLDPEESVGRREKRQPDILVVE